ncbi:MAG: hypothetical protein K8W52_14915 [Deltaproteobacteria bacterium]|nr:hypothetical protein [Deltaproteobacteria bacterium]
MASAPASDPRGRAALWRIVGGGLIAVAVVLILAVIPAHHPRDGLKEILVDGVMRQTPAWTFSPAAYPWMYVIAGAIAVVGIERLVRGGGVGRRGTSRG